MNMSMGNKKKVYYKVPAVGKITTNYSGECLWNFGKGKFKAKTISVVLGLGLVERISKGKEFDIIYMNFGRGYTENVLRMIIVQRLNARKQIYTLKKGQFAFVYGMRSDFTEKDEQGVDKHKCVIYAEALQGWYVPKVVDIEHSETLDELVEMEEQECTDGQDFLTQFENY